jgi:beta-mannosidase
MLKNNVCYFIIIVILFSLSSCRRNKQKENDFHRYTLNNDWEFADSSTTEWLSASVPGCVQNDLFEHNLIPNIFNQSNADSIKWVAEKTWIYKKTFDIPISIFNKKHIYLILEGIDTYANIYLNKKKLFSANNMFRKWKIDVKAVLLEQDNELEIHFHNPIEKNNSAQENYAVILPEVRAFSRKAPYQFGWDWAPEILSCGIWKEVYIEAWDNIKIENIYVYTTSITEKNAIIYFESEVISDKEQNIQYQIINTDKAFEDITDDVLLKKGKNVIQKEIPITNPKLWWPNGMGEQNVYEIQCIVQTEENADTLEGSFGIRTIELITEKDSIGENFYFKVNGIPCYMKGANYVPPHSLPSQITKEMQEALIATAVKSNFNMLRVWGGGIYESDYFYELCDKNGILIWQDFMFACAMYPGDTSFLHNVEHEIEDNIIRLRNHPCIALWCGNNEVKNGWEDWGWQEKYSKEEITHIEEAYYKLFQELIPNKIKQLDSTRAYWPSSPSWGWGHEESFTEGDSHYWGVWWGKESFDIFYEKNARFMSEYGFQAIPSYKTMLSFIDEEPISLDNKHIQFHQKHPVGNETIIEYLEREFIIPTNFKELIYISQLLQAWGIQKALDTHRKDKKYCMGTLYWQFNDCWPAISWSSVDYYGQWKALQYFVQDAFHSLYLIPIPENNGINIYLANDYTKDIEGELRIQLKDFYGNIIYKTKETTKINANNTAKLTRIDIENFPLNYNPRLHYLHIEFETSEENIQRNYFFTTVKDIQIPKNHIEITNLKKNNNGYSLSLKTNKFAHSVYLSSDKAIFFENNFFHIEPKEEITVQLTTKETITINDIHFLCLNDLYGKINM